MGLFGVVLVFYQWVLPSFGAQTLAASTPQNHLPGLPMDLYVFSGLVYRVGRQWVSLGMTVECP